MKLNGVSIEARYKKTISFKRSPEPIVLTLHSFLGDEDFEKICPTPEPPLVTRPGGEKTAAPDDPDYQKELTDHSRKNLQYMIIKTIQDIEWETVDFDDPASWANWEKEFTDSGFSTNEVVLLQNQIFEVNGLSEDSVTDAVKN